MRSFPERDWKEFSRIQPIVLNRFCQKILDKASRLAAPSSEGTPHGRYLKLYQHIQREDRKIADAFNRYSRSTALETIMLLYSRGMMTREELERFTEETRNLVVTICNR